MPLYVISTVIKLKGEKHMPGETVDLPLKEYKRFAKYLTPVKEDKGNEGGKKK